MVFALVCLWIVIAKTNNVYAEPFHATSEQLEGTAYAVLTDAGELILFRSNDTYTDGVGQTVTDIKGNTYTGRVYTGIETTNTNAETNSKWYSQRTNIKSVHIADGQAIKPINTSHWFSGCNNSNLTTIDLSSLDTSNVIKMNSMFYNCSKLTNLDVSRFDTSNVTNMAGVFINCSGLTSLDVSGIDTGNVTDMNSMFSGCSNLTSLNVSGFDTGNVTRMDYMFNGCSNLTSLNVSDFDTGNVTKISSMFQNCSNLTSLNISGFDTSKVTDTGQMFFNCTSLASLDISGFDTSNVTYISYMFSGCLNLSFVNLGANFSFKGKNITNTSRQAILPTPYGTDYTGKWIKDDESAGPYTPAELRDNYNGATMAGTWVWQETPTKYTLIFTADEGISGSMPNAKAVAAEDFTIPENKFYQFGKDFDHWEVVTETRAVGDTYEDMATIPANRYAVGDKVTLKAIMKDADTSYTIKNGEFDFYLRANERATFKNIPAGTAYQVYEETPDGWILVDQSNVSGTIEPLKTSRAQFVNKYQPDITTVQFTGTKKLDGYAVPEGAYSFELYEEGKDDPIETVATKDGGFVQFSVIEYTQDDVGDHTYHIKEVDPNNDAIDWDKHEETITVNVKDNGDGTLSAKATYDSGGIVFNNRTKPGMLKITKRTNIKTPANQNDKFTFNITFNNEKGQPISDDIYWYSEGVNRPD